MFSGTLTATAQIRGKRMRRLTVLLTAPSLALVTSGCWLQLGGDASRQNFHDENGITSANVGSLTQQWSKAVPAGAKSPVIYGGIFVAGGDTVTAFGVGGDQLWQRTFTDSGFSAYFGTPAMVDGRIAVPVSIAGLGGMYSFDRATGDNTGSVNFHELSSAAPAVRGGIVALTGGSFGSGGPVVQVVTYNGRTGLVATDFGAVSAPMI